MSTMAREPHPRVRASMGFITERRSEGEDAPGSGQYPTWMAPEGNPDLRVSNSSYLSDDGVLFAARSLEEEHDKTRVKEGETHLMGLHGFAVHGQGEAGIGINFVVVDNGAQVCARTCCQKFHFALLENSADRACAHTCLQIAEVKEGGPAALHGQLAPGDIFVSVDGQPTKGKSLEVRKKPLFNACTRMPLTSKEAKRTAVWHRSKAVLWLQELVVMLTGDVGSDCILEMYDSEDINVRVAITRGTVPPPKGTSACLDSSQLSQQITPVKTAISFKGADMTGNSQTKIVDILVPTDVKKKSPYRLPGSSGSGGELMMA